MKKEACQLALKGSNPSSQFCNFFWGGNNVKRRSPFIDKTQLKYNN
jgi:hypothetical protein